MGCFSEILSRRSYKRSPFPSAVDTRLTCSLNRHGDDRAEVETVADAAALIVDTRMADSVGIDPAGAGFADDIRHSIEHARSGIDVRTWIAEKEHVGIGGVEEPLNARG